MQQAIWQHVSADTGSSLTPEQIAAANNSRLLAQLLVGRGISTPQAMREFLNMEGYQPSSGDELPDAEVGLARMIKAIDDQENILVYGDFDVDGQTGTSIFYKTLKHLGAQVSFYIPDRATEGHGLNSTAVCKLVSSRGIKLLITTDTGITDFNEVSLLNGLGVDVIVTDHHDLPEQLPPSFANINPKCMDDRQHPMYEMCGAGVAFKLCEILCAHYEKTEICDELLAIAAIGTVVDMMPLTRENRWIVWAGLKILNRRELLGVEALLAIANFDDNSNNKHTKPVTSETIGFVIGPRLNALGRLEKADDGVHLLLAETMDVAHKIATHLDALNRRRQDMCEVTVQEAEQFLARMGGLGNEKAIVLASPSWHPGIIGLAATRLKDRYNVPIFLMIVDDKANQIRCSARSIVGFHLHEAMTELKDYFLHFGGHAGAGGFAIQQDDFEQFKAALLAVARRKITDDMCRPTLEVDAMLQWHQLNPSLNEVLEGLQPTGQGNPSPLFETEPLRMAAHRWMGEKKNHIKMVLEPTQGKAVPAPLDAICWSARDKYLVNNGDVGRFVFSPSINVFQGKETFQLMVRDMAIEQASPAHHGVNRSSDQPKQGSMPSGEVIQVSPAHQANSKKSHEGGHEVSWVDHRHRTDPVAFVGQLLTQPQTRLFYEGGTPLEIPFFQAHDALTRTHWVEADDLIFWSMPSSERLLHQVLSVVKPKTVHVFATEPCPPSIEPRDGLKPVYRYAQQQLAQSQEGHTLSLIEWASGLSLSEDTVLAGLLVLARIQAIKLGAYDAITQTVVGTWLGQAGAGGQRQDVSVLPELGLFGQLLNQQVAFQNRWRVQALDGWHQWAVIRGLKPANHSQQDMSNSSDRELASV